MFQKSARALTSPAALVSSSIGAMTCAAKGDEGQRLQHNWQQDEASTMCRSGLGGGGASAQELAKTVAAGQQAHRRDLVAQRTKRGLWSQRGGLSHWIAHGLLERALVPARGVNHGKLALDRKDVLVAVSSSLRGRTKRGRGARVAAGGRRRSGGRRTRGALAASTALTPTPSKPRRFHWL